MPYVLLLIAFVAAILCLLYFFRKKLSSKLIDILVKCGGITLFALLFVKCFLADGFVYVINGGEYEYMYYKQTDVISTFARWFLLFDGCLAVTSAFFGETSKRAMILFGFPTAVIPLVFFNRLLGYYIAPDAPAIRTAEWIRVLGFCAEMALILLLPLIYRFVQGIRIGTANKQERSSVIKLAAFEFMLSMPLFTLGSLFGSPNTPMQMGDIWHIGWMLSIIVAFCVMYFAFRKEQEGVKWEFLSYLILYTFINCNTMFVYDTVSVGQFPFQLCQVGCYLLLVLLFTKSQKLFNFILTANCSGCLVAIITVPMDDNLLEFWSSRYYIEHSLVLLIPLLAVAFGLFRTPTFGKAIKHFFVGFSIYYAVCFFLDCLENGVLRPLYHDTIRFFDKANFLYLMKCPIDALSELEAALQKPLPITVFGVRSGLPYLLFIYVSFSVISLSVFSLFKGVYTLINKWAKASCVKR